VGRRTDVLASNRLARAVLTDFEALPAVHRDLARFTLLDPAARELYADWEANARESVEPRVGVGAGAAAVGPRRTPPRG
jgi:MmyB-like transcription regulator ligand binding domain